MVNSRAEALDFTFGALADPTRRLLLERLAEGPTTVGRLAAPLPMSLVAVGKHLAVLERARLISRARDGRTVVCALRPHPLGAAARWLECYRGFWNDRLDSLHDHLVAETEVQRP
jgi:DNA-binding transcriptional ArsR family regulator